MIAYMFVLAIQLALAIFMLYLCLAFVTGAPFVPSTNKTAESMIKLARIKKGMTVYDLGSGDGKLLFLAAQKGATAIGFEINPWLVIYTNLRAFFSPYRGQIKAQWKNLWTAKFFDADVVFIYLMPWRMEKLQQKLKKGLKKRTVIVSNSFIFPDTKIVRQDAANHAYVFHI